MSQFTRLKMAPAGREVLALCHQGATLALSQIVLGNGEWTAEQQSGSPPGALVSPKRAVSITSIVPQGDTAIVRGMLVNVGLEEGFSITEIGITATHPQTGLDVLYMADYCPQERSSYFPAASSGVPTVEIPISCQILIASGGEVELVVRDRFFSASLQDIDDHNTDNAAHPGLRMQAPVLAFTGPDHIDEGGSTTLAVQGYVPGTWPAEAAVKVTDASGSNVSSLFTRAWNPATGVITLTAPMVAASATYHVSVQLWEHGLIRSADWSDPVTLLVADVPVHKPNITAPAAGATGLGATPTLTSSAYAADGGQTHVASQWQVSLTPDMAAPVYDSGQDATHLVSCPIPGGSALLEGHHYYTRVRHKGSNGDWSPWSTVSDFFTSASFIYVSQPTITSPASGATDIGETPTLTASAFSTNGAGTHLNTDWQVDLTSGDFSSPVYQAMADAAQKTSLAIPAGHLLAGHSYKARVRYRDNSGTPVVSDWSGLVTFSTAASFDPFAASAHTFRCDFLNPSAGGNEAGSGRGLSGDNLIVSQHNNVPGSSDGWRALSGGTHDKYFHMAADALNTLFARAQWTVLTRVKVAAYSASISMMFNYLYPGPNLGYYDDTRLRMVSPSDGKNLITQAAMPLDTALWVAMSTGPSGIRCGWTTAVNPPPSWADIPSSQQARDAAHTDYSGRNFAAESDNALVGEGSYNTFDGSVYRILVTDYELPEA